MGAAGFFIPQIVIRLPILSVLSLSEQYKAFIKNNYVLYCLILAFTAGLFEVTGRYITAKVLQKNLTFKKGISLGMGHGGVEAIALIGMTYINNLIFIVMINTGSFDTFISQYSKMGVDTESLAAVKTALTESGSAVFYLAGYERILTMIFHIFLSLLVCYFVMKKKDLLGIIICLLLHTAADFIIPIVNGLSTEYLGNIISQTTAYIIIYSILTLVGVLSLIMIFKIKKQWKSAK